MMESKQLSLLSSLRAESKPEDYIQPHYKEAYRLAIDSLVRGGSDSYHEFLKGERLSSFLSKEELLFITANAQEPVIGNHTEETDGSPDSKSSSGTYWPVHSDVETPDLELGWPEYVPQRLQTNIDLLFHPPRLNSPTIKEVIRKHMQDSRQLIAIVMDTFTDVDIFKEAVDASLRGVSVYVLLDDVHIQSFISMAESQDIHFQKLRNMRIRTVKGHEYLCRSGAKFHGSMEQKFLLVDCETVIYGSYSYMWSFEKIHLSMVQVIKGQLVGSYDEEFRTLYARSSVPAMLCPPEGVADAGRTNGRRGVAKYASPAGQVFDRKDQLRHTLDTVYKKACERQLGVREAEERLYEEEPFDQQSAALFNPGPVNVQSHIKKFQPAETVNFLKRHSYAGERKEPSYVPQNIHFGASHWNVAGDEGYHNGRVRCSNDVGDHTQHQQQGNHMFRGHNIRQSYHGNDKQILMMKQNMPTYENTSKSFLRTWRIDSYLNNNDPPIGEYSDYLDQYEPPLESKAAPYMSSRLRSSLVFKSTIPEQPENNYYTNNSLHSSGQMDSANAPNTHQPHQALYHCSMENPSERVMDNRARLEEFQNKRKSLQILDDPRGNVGFNPMRGSHHSIYGSLNRAKGGTQIRNTDIFQNNWHKRHSVADPRFNTENRDHRESSSHMYGFSRNQAERSMPGNNLQNEGYSSNLNEDQRSVSHYDVKSVTDTKSQPALKWQEPPSRTVSAAALDVNTKETTNHTSPHFLKTSSKKIRSLLNIPEKKESTSLLKGSRSSRAGCSSDTLTDREELGSDRDRERGTQRNSTNSSKSPSELFVNRNHFGEDIGSSSAPRFSTEEIAHSPADSAPSIGTQQQQQQQQTSTEKRDKSSLKSGEWRLRNQKVDGRLYSRFEPFCAFDKKQSPPTHQASVSANTHTQEQPKNIVLSKGRSASEQQNHHGQPTHGHHENKLGKFIQRVGNLINKNK